MTMFSSRLRRQWANYRLLYDQLFDWTIALYAAAFLIAASVYFIRETVLEGHYGLFAVLPEALYIVGVLFVAVVLRPQSMTEEADVLFWYRTKDYIKLKRAALYYSAVIHAIYVVLLITAVAIFLVPIYNVSLLTLIQLFITTMAVYVISAYSIVRMKQWLYTLGMICIVLSSTAAFMLSPLYTAITAVVSIVSVLFAYERTVIQTNRYIAALVEQERAYKQRWQNRLFLVSPQLQQIKPHWHRKKRPFLFTKATVKTPEAALQQLLLKTIWRDTTYVSTLLRLIGISFLPALLLPAWVGYLLTIGCWLALLQFTESLVQKLREHHLFRLIHYNDAQWFQAFARFKYKLTLPVPFLLIILVTVKLIFA